MNSSKLAKFAVLLTLSLLFAFGGTSNIKANNMNERILTSREITEDQCETVYDLQRKIKSGIFVLRHHFDIYGLEKENINSNELELLINYNNLHAVYAYLMTDVIGAKKTYDCEANKSALSKNSFIQYLKTNIEELESQLQPELLSEIRTDQAK